MPTILITGANRGLGLEFCRQYADAGWDILACCRHPEQADALNQLSKETGQVQVYRLNVTDFSNIEALADQLAHVHLDVLLNNAGVYGDTRQTPFGKLDYQTWMQTFSVNSMAPVKMAEVFLPHLMRAQSPKLVTITSRMGSITDNGSGDCILYRSSKAALNAAMKSLSLDLKAQGIAVQVLHPGWVHTEMGGPNALIDPPESIQGMRKVIDELTTDNAGRFLNYKGEELPW